MILYKLKKRKEKYKYLDLAQGLKKLKNTRVVSMPIVMCLFRMVPKDLEKGLEELEIYGNIQITVLLWRAKILGRIRKNQGDLLLIRFQ